MEKRSKYGSGWIKTTMNFNFFDAIPRNWSYEDITEESLKSRGEKNKENCFWTVQGGSSTFSPTVASDTTIPATIPATRPTLMRESSDSKERIAQDATTRTSQRSDTLNHTA